ncbi:2-keto-4-pentenoate hydratase [Leucobacter sp. CSA2]|uniref:2-keto-4-pentenoate hydratase n=1 Tax=Leucobacter edaphi TaxID=2796472 RepID=A0A934QEL5_9MICO|nr:2-keto-4-pentenoate hydratase [Leucobacter edaphi]MBK0422019.1 2-keto-4-pentenoate hydratase [Leucobacter edaphi]
MNNEVISEALDIDAAAQELRRAEAALVGVRPLTERFPGLTLAEAYAIQRANIDRRLAQGERLTGRKIGLTSLAMQRQLGVDQPDFGAITDAMEVANGGEFDPGRLLKPRLEVEFAFELGADLPSSPTYDELVAAVSGVALGIEIIDSRVADWRITLLDTVADNASMARVVWGEFVPATPELLDALPAAVATLLRDGEIVSSGPGSAVLGHPLTSLHWLGEALGAQGDRFLAGDRVLAGAVAAATDFVPGARWTAEADGLPGISLTSTSSTEREKKGGTHS